MAKVCTKCLLSQPESEFDKHGSITVLNPVCKKCRSKQASIRFINKQKEYKELLNLLGCSVCLEKHPDCLEVHHIKGLGKRGRCAHSNMRDLKNKSAIVLCSNCHSLFHSHWGGKNHMFPEQTKESTIEVVKLQRRIGMPRG